MNHDPTEPRQPTGAPKPQLDSSADLPPNLPDLDPAAAPEEDEEARLPEIVDAGGEEVAEGPLAVGRAAIERAVRLAPLSPGVYRMLNAAGDVLYVGKTQSVRERLPPSSRPPRPAAPISRVIGAAAAG